MKIKYIFLILSLWLISIGIVWFLTRRAYVSVFKNTPSVINVPFSPPDTFRDVKGVSHARFNVVKLQKELYAKQVDSLSKLLEIKASQVNSHTEIVSNISGHFHGDTVYVHDTIYSFKKNSDYVDISGQVSPNSWDIDLSLDDTLKATTYTKKHLFRPNETIIDISNTNPHVHVKEGKSIQLQSHKSKITIGPYIGYGWTISDGGVYKGINLGIGAQWNIISF